MGVRRWSVVLLLALTPLTATGATCATDPSAHRPGLRDQWQPQTEHDPRLSQPVHIEILGRAAVPALETLSKETGVMLQVAPENLDTVGERKLTIIAQGCSLKSLMVQIPNALQECHWDVDVRNGEQVYLLHRDGGIEATMAELAQASNLRHQEERRPAREERLAQARAALAMTPDELDELRKTDPFLWAQMKDPEARHRLQLLLNLSPEDMKEFVETGRAYMTYVTAPPDYQEAARQGTESFLVSAAKSEHPSLKAWAQVVREVLPQAGICFEDYDEMGISLLVQYYNTSDKGPSKGDVLRAGGGSALPPRMPDEDSARRWYGPMLLKAGMTEKELESIISEQAKEHAEQRREQRDRKRDAEWVEPSSPALHKIVTLPPGDSIDKLEMQRFIARETGLSLVSDYFTTWGSGRIPEEARQPVPMWRLLYLLGESWYWSYDWNAAGDCTVFHDSLWYIYAPQEFPESMVGAYREKLERQGRFTLDDITAAAVELARHRPVPTRQRGEWPWSNVNVPPDLERAGLSGRALRSEALLLYASLPPAQREQACREEGLSYAEMTAAQQTLVRPYAFYTGGWDGDRHPIPEGEIAQAVFRVKTSRHASDAGQWEQVLLQIEFPSLVSETALRLRVPKQP